MRVTFCLPIGLYWNFLNQANKCIQTLPHMQAGGRKNIWLK
jgi:hypothetical protein